MDSNNKIAKLIFVLLITLMTLPLVFSFVPSSRGKALFGIVQYDNEKVSLWRILDHTWQDKAEIQAKQKVGFCNYGVRFYNELNYRLFRFSAAPRLVLGQDDYFYEDIYVNEYTGKDFVGDSLINANVKAFQKLQSQLHAQGTELILVLEPSKARYMPEYLPKRCHNGARTNYNSYVKALQQHGVQYLDLNQYFRSIKKTTKYPLYSQHGIHWTTYGMWTAADTLQHFIEQQCALSLNSFKHTGDSISNKNKDLDFDLEPPMNLMRELKHENLGFPIMQFQQNGQAQPEALIIADSYVWSLWDNHILHHWFNNPEFWYYNQTVYPDIWEPNSQKVDKSTTQAVVKGKKVVLLMITTANLRDFSWGFLQDMEGQQ